MHLVARIAVTRKAILLETRIVAIGVMGKYFPGDRGDGFVGRVSGFRVLLRPDSREPRLDLWSVKPQHVKRVMSSMSLGTDVKLGMKVAQSHRVCFIDVKSPAGSNDCR